MQRLLEKIRQTGIDGKTVQKNVFFRFKLSCDPVSQEYTLAIVDKKGAACFPSAASETGALRFVLTYMEQLTSIASFSVNWSSTADEQFLKKNVFSLSEHPRLLRLTAESGRLIDAQDNPISLSEHEHVLSVKIDAKSGEKMLNANFFLDDQPIKLNEKSLVTDSLLLMENRLYPLRSAGPYFRLLTDFSSPVTSTDISLYLSLFHSFFQGVPLFYHHYKTVLGEPIDSQPALIISESISGEIGEIELRAVNILEELSPLPLEDIYVSLFAEILPMEETALIREINTTPSDSILKQVRDSIAAFLTDDPKERRKKMADMEIDGEKLFLNLEAAQVLKNKALFSLAGKYRLLGESFLKNIGINKVSPKINFTWMEAENYFEGDDSIEIEDKHYRLQELLASIRVKGYIDLGGKKGILDQKSLSRLERLLADNGKNGKLRLSFFDLPAIEEFISKKSREGKFAEFRALYEGFNKIENQQFTPPAVTAELRAYQTYGCRWLRYLRQNSLGGCLADDMGLGKTLQTLCVLADLYPENKQPSLIVMPKSLIFNWQRELETFASQIKFAVHYGADRSLDEKSAGKFSGVILTTYGTLRRDIKWLRQVEFVYVILDESQTIKNHASQTAKAAMLLSAQHRLALSGTPVENNLAEVYSLFRFLNPPMFGGFTAFNRRYVEPLKKGAADKEEALDELQKRIYPFILRRLKEDVLNDLPEKIEQQIIVEMEPAHAQLYEERRRFYHANLTKQAREAGMDKTRFNILQAMSDLRQIATNPEARSGGSVPSSKREGVVNHILEAAANHRKTLLYSSYLGPLEALAEDMETEGIGSLTMTGSSTNREKLVQQFMLDPAVTVFLMTLKTGGVGLNLTAADTVIIYDPWWNVAAERQAIDRAHRIGQKKTVLAYRFIVKNTIEEKIALLQQKKRELFDRLIKSDSEGVKLLQTQDIDFIFGK